jgi:hypothetical protein
MTILESILILQNVLLKDEGSASPGAKSAVPSEVLARLGQPSSSTSELTHWGQFVSVVAPELVNALIWSSVSLSQFDQDRLLLNDEQVRHWFPIKVSNAKHVAKVHDVGTPDEARQRYLSVQYMADGLHRRLHTAETAVADDIQKALLAPWLIAENAPVVFDDFWTFGVIRNRDIVLQRGGQQLSIVALLADTDWSGSQQLRRFEAYKGKIFLQTKGGDEALALARFPVGWTSPDRYMIEFNHALGRLPSPTEMSTLRQVAEFAATMIQSVLAPRLIERIDDAAHTAVINNVVNHAIKNHVLSCLNDVKKLRKNLQTLKGGLAAKAANSVLDDIQFRSRILDAGLESQAIRRGTIQSAAEERLPLPEFLEKLRKLCELEQLTLNVDEYFTRGIANASVPRVALPVLANLVENAVRHNQRSLVDGDEAPKIIVNLLREENFLKFKIASPSEFDIGKWREKAGKFTHTPPDIHRGLWLSDFLLRSVGAACIAGEQNSEFGCILSFRLPL